MKLKITLTLLILTLAGAAPAAEKPDVLFIAIDDMNDWTTLFDENNPIRTPNLKRLAARGAMFRRGYCASPACSPSRAAIMTGVAPRRSGLVNNGGGMIKAIPDGVTLGHYFGQNGYETHGAGKIFHHGGAGRDYPDRPAFQNRRPFRNDKKLKSGNLNGYKKSENRPLSALVYDWGERADQLEDERMVQWCVDVMKTAPKKPRFLASGIFKPHLPFYADAKTFSRYPQTVMPEMPEDDLDDIGAMGIRFSKKEHFIYEHVTRHAAPDPRSHERMVQCYQASADFADQMVGRLIDGLDASGRAGNTIVVLWSDHGYHLGDKQSCVKFTLWEKANRVPFIIVAPGVTAPGTVIEQPVSLLDIYPTLLELCGLSPREENDGNSLVPLMKAADPDMAWPPALMSYSTSNAIRTRRFRYIRYVDQSEELYADSDPWNHTNLAGLAEYADTVAEHRKLLDKRLAKLRR